LIEYYYIGLVTEADESDIVRLSGRKQTGDQL